MCFTLARIDKQRRDFKSVVDSPSASISKGLPLKVIPQPSSHISHVGISKVKRESAFLALPGV